MGNLKLFLWNEVLKDYSYGLMFAVAETVEQAREQLKAAYAREERVQDTEYLFGKDEDGDYWDSTAGRFLDDLTKEPEVIYGPFARIKWGGA